MTQRLHTVVLPVAGQGTRMLPATKSVPKELLPVYDTPLLQFALDEAVAAGARCIVLVNHPSKTAILDYISHDRALERKLSDDNKDELLSRVKKASLPKHVEVIIADQETPLGLGHAVLCGADAVKGDRFGVILPDDLILGGPGLAEMAEAYDPEKMHSLIAAMDVPRDKVSRYGIFDTEDGATSGAIPAHGFVEKPDPEDAPSTLAAVGRYILDPAIFDLLRRQEAGAGGEIQLTDAIAAMGGICAFRFSGTRYDCGSKDGLLDASLAYKRTLQAAPQADRTSALAAE